ncbi:MAG: MBOAT family protein [Bacteroidetes bacterium]|nr:MBOAT family protein [Bacteroidota bacterium]
MEFNSAAFIVVFLLFYVIYCAVGNSVFWRRNLLLVFNLFFYFLLSKSGLFILLAIALWDYFLALKIGNTQDENKRRRFLYFSVVLDIGSLLLFRHFTDWFGPSVLGFWPAVIGISYFVFRSMGYVLDVYHENVEIPEKNWFSYLTYLSFFPLILAGPISPARDFLPALQQPFVPRSVPSGKAVFLLITGIVKKFIFSGYLAVNFTDRVFASPHLFTGMENGLAAISQALVVYLDFSGYTDLMLGVGLLLGFSLSENFNFPYTSANISEYWRRWHMSLSKWLNEYLFFPLSFSLRRFRTAGTIMAVCITFAISGFWHGTAFHFTFWGLLHAVALSWDILSNRLRDRMKKYIYGPVYTGISVLLTFAFLALSGIFFKAPDMAAGFLMVKKIFTDPQFGYFADWLQAYKWVFVVMLNVLIWHWILPDSYEKVLGAAEKIPWWLQGLALFATVFLAYTISGLEAQPFIYLQF